MSQDQRALCEARLAADPNDVAARHALGLLLPPEEGIAQLRHAIALQPMNADLHNSLGTRLLGLGRHAEAQSGFEHALLLDPRHEQALYHLAFTRHTQHRLADAIAGYEAALAVQPALLGAWLNRGTALHALGLHDQALASFEAALRIDPDHPVLRYNHAMALHRAMRLPEALASYDRAIAADPGHIAARWNRGLCRLTRGDLASGFADQEWGFDIGKRQDRGFSQPRWQGGPLAGRRILLHAEGGLGDTLQFARYAAVLKRGGAHVVLEVQPALTRLLTTLAGVDELVTQGSPLPAFDIHVPMFSVPAACATTLATIPADIPYLHADPAQAARWRAALPGFSVGLVWAGGHRPDDPAAHDMDQRRSLPLAALAPLAAIPGLRFVSLQKGPPAAQCAKPPFPIADPTALLADFADTAALVSALDMVISVDTSTAHLAGALGRPVWLLNRFDTCWRWLTDRSDTPWYPTMRLFRQPQPGFWAGVVDELAGALREMRASSAPGPHPAQR